MKSSTLSFPFPLRVIQQLIRWNGFSCFHIAANLWAKWFIVKKLSAWFLLSFQTCGLPVQTANNLVALIKHFSAFVLSEIPIFKRQTSKRRRYAIRHDNNANCSSLVFYVLHFDVGLRQLIKRWPCGLWNETENWIHCFGFSFCRLNRVANYFMYLI